MARQGLKFIVRRRFGSAATAVGYHRDADDPNDDIVLVKVFAGDEVLWDSTPHDADLGEWEAIGTAVDRLVEAVKTGPVRGYDLVHQL